MTNKMLPSERRVLVVENDAAIRSLIRAVLRRDGFEVDESSSAAEAITHLRTRRYSAIVLELMLPDGSGLEVLREIDSLPPEHHCVVVVSAASPAVLDSVSHARVRSKLRKPFDISALTAAIHGCMGTDDEQSRPVLET